MQRCVVIQGTCGWQDQQYPDSVKRDAASRLAHFSKTWPSVEVNSSCYAVLSPAVTQSWCRATPPGFIFHFKAFGLFCSRGSAVGNLPAPVREMLASTGPSQASGSAYVHLSDMPPAAVAKTWELFHASLKPVYKAGRLGVVVFQFHLSFQPSAANLDYVLECRRGLDPRYRMAVEFRCRKWFVGAEWREKAHAALAQHGIAWVAADELEHETFQKDREQKGLPAGAERTVLPIAMEVTTPECSYVRVHRRHGMEDRRLSADEIAAWVGRITSIGPQLRGPVYFLWGTDHRNVPQMNRSALAYGIPAEMRYDWKAVVQSAPGSILGMLRASKKTTSPRLGELGDEAICRRKSDNGSAAVVAKRGIKRFFAVVDDT